MRGYQALRFVFLGVYVIPREKMEVCRGLHALRTLEVLRGPNRGPGSLEISSKVGLEATHQATKSVVKALGQGLAKDVATYDFFFRDVSEV